ncbi:MAG: hypothetical protein C4K60_14430 [Ideonella sp. MAG2]|nr:MAG: hypothetical protein C4K60_14430 [Ideonella sp. MAG2]
MKKSFYAWVLALHALSFGAAAETLPVYNTYLTPPYVVGDGGLAADTVAYMNKKLDGKFELKLNNLVRARLNFVALDSKDFKGAVLFMAPMFVGDNDKTKYNWSDTLIKDGNAVLSPAASKFSYSGPEALDGKLFVGVAGYRYAGLDDKFGKSIKREDVSNEESILKRMVEGKGDVALMAHSIAKYYVKQPEFSGKVNIDPKPYSTFTRHVLISKANPELSAELQKIVKEAEKDPAWKAITAKYGL